MHNQFFTAPDRAALLAAPVRGLLLRMAVPSLAAMLATGLCTLLDALLLARESPGVSAAAGVCFPILAAQQTVGFTLGMGAGSHVSRVVGAGEEASARQVAAAALLLALLLGLALLASGFFLLTPLLSRLGADADVLPHAAAYARPLLLASPLSCVGLVLASLLRAQGKAALNMLAYVVSGSLGAGLSVLFILHLGLGAYGAGLALLSREALACLLLIILYLRARNMLRPGVRDITLRPWVFPAILRSGLPTLLRQGAASLSGAMLSRAAAAAGSAALSGMGIAVRVLALISSAAIGFGQGFAPVCGVNFGAGKHDRVQDAYRYSMRVLVAALLVCGALLFAFAGRLLALFSAEAQVAAFAVRVLRAQSPVLACQGAVILMNMLTQSRGQTVRATLVAISRQGLFLIPLLLTLPRLFGETGFVLCQSAADVCALVFSLCVLRAGRRGEAECAGPIDRTPSRD